jgi:hypothetical protein
MDSVKVGSERKAGEELLLQPTFMMKSNNLAYLNAGYS